MKYESFLTNSSSGTFKLLLEKGSLSFHEFIVQTIALALLEEPGEYSKIIILDSETGIVVYNAIYQDGLFEWQE